MTNLPQNHLANLVKIAASAQNGALSHYQKNGLQYVDVPAIVGITGACENVNTLFKVENRLNLPLFFAQTGQLALEQALQYFPGVATVIHSARDEEEEDDRHLRQFRLTEEEFDCTLANMTRQNYNEEKMFSALLSHIEKATKSMLATVLADHKKLLATNYQRDPKNLAAILSRPYLQIDYAAAIDLLNKSAFPDLKFGDDLNASHEAKIVALLNLQNKNYGRKIEEWSPVFIFRYPKEIKFFNMKVSSSDPRVVLSADCIFPFSGESVGAAVREHDGIKLIVRLLTSTMYKLHEQRGGKYDDFKWYTEDIIVAQKTNPHAGYGIGNERIIQFILGLFDIRSCSTFSLMASQTGDWDQSRRGLLPMVSHRKTVLLSIGKEEDKAKLLPHIERVKTDGHVFYATTKTHRFLEQHGVPTTHVHKISEEGRPNLKDLLNNNTIDLIINTPNNPQRTDEVTDGQFIRTSAIATGTTLVTDPAVAQSLLDNLAKRNEGTKDSQ